MTPGLLPSPSRGLLPFKQGTFPSVSRLALWESLKLDKTFNDSHSASPVSAVVQVHFPGGLLQPKVTTG